MSDFDLLPDRERFRCSASWTWSLANGESISLKEGYTFNISTPFARTAVAALVFTAGWGWLLRAVCVHDYLIGKRKMRRPRAGFEFYRAMIFGGGPMRAVAVFPLGITVTLWRFWA